MRAIAHVAAAGIGAAAMFGWGYGHPWLTAWSDTAVTMKWSTSVCCVVAGMGGAAQYSKPRYWRVPVVAGAALLLSAGMTSQLAIALGGAFPGSDLGRVLAPMGDRATETVSPGVASVGTMVAYTLIATMLCLRVARLGRPIRALAWIVVALGVIAIVGHAIDVPELRWHIPGKSTAMAIPTAVAFALTGWGHLDPALRSAEPNPE